MSAHDPLAALRRATAERHALLDASLAIGAASATLDDYASHLRMLRTWMAPIDAWLAGFGDGPAAVLAPVARVESIDADLADPAMPQGAGIAGDSAPAWPADASAAYRWGVCYVVEGSQLGGAVLYQRLAAQLAPHPLRYLRGDAAGPGPRWRSFMLALKEEVRTEAQVAEACAGACDAFDRILALAQCN